MPLRPFFTNELSDLKFAKPLDHQRANDQAGKHRRQAGEGRAEGQVPKNAERREVVEKFYVQQPVKQSASGKSLSLALGLRSSAEPFLCSTQSTQEFRLAGDG